MGICKIKVIQTDLGIFMHISAYSGMAYSGITQAYLEPCVTLLYIEPLDIQNLYSVPCQISAIECFAKIINNYNYFHKL